MSRHNPTPLTIGMRGTIHGWSVRVTARMVLGVEIDGETYYWNEYILDDDRGNAGTLVYEVGEHGPEWKLFREFQPRHPLTAAEAATKRVGDTVNLDGNPTRITLIDESRVYHLEGEPPEGVQVGDVAHYFNADAGARMLVASWTGDEIEFYDGRDVTASLVASAFNFPQTARDLRSSGAESFRAGRTGRPSSVTVGKVIAVLLFVAVGAGVFLWNSSRRPAASAATPTRPAAPPLKLAPGAQGRLGLDEFTIVGSTEVEVARTRGRIKPREYQLQDARGETAFLVSGLTGAALEWHLLRPTELANPRDPYQAATLRRNAQLTVDGQPARVAELFRSTTLTTEGNPAALPPSTAVRYGFLAQRTSDWIVARWDESTLQFHVATPYAESDIKRAFVGAAPAQVP